MNRYLTFLIVVLFSLQVLNAQKLLELKAYDTTVYVYQLDKEQLDFLVKKQGISDTSFLFSHLYKKLSRTSDYLKVLPPGNFLVATINQSTIYYQYVANPSFVLSHKVIGNDVVLFIKDKKNKTTLTNAEVKINQLPVNYNAGYGGYVVDKNAVSPDLSQRNQALLSVSLGTEYSVQHYSFVSGYRGSYSGRTRRSRNQYTSSSGYFISDKPVYRPGDTVRMKAYLTNPLNGKAFKGRAEISIQENTQNFHFTKKIKAVSPGAFVFEWIIPDTLKIDRRFYLNLTYQHRSNRYYQSASFYLENYQLNANQYQATMVKPEFYPGEDAHFRLSATDANGFPLQGTMIHYQLQLSGVRDFFGDTLLLSESKRMNLFEQDSIYPYASFMDLKIPASVFPAMDANYNLELRVTDPSTFEQKVLPLYFSRFMKKEQILINQNEDSLIVRFLINGKDSTRSYRLISLHNGDTLHQQRITTPFRFQLSPYATQVHLYDQQNMPTVVNVAFHHFQISHVNGKRSADSVHISFSFPFKEAIHYRILKKDKVIQQGETQKLDFKIADQSKDPYSILFTSNVNNAIENNFYRITYVPPLHKINLKTTLPQQAFPGQKLHVTVQATDCYNKPLEKVNIAAFAVNKQFEERFVTPEIAVPESFKDKIQVNPEASIDQVSLYLPSYQAQFFLSPDNFNRFDLYHNEYYQLYYPKGDYGTLQKTIQSPHPEFAISVTSNHLAYTPKYILLDGQPVYISDLKGAPYSFQATAGKHQVTFRFFNKKITLNDVSFEANTKYWFGFHLDSLRKLHNNNMVIDSLPAAQPDEAEKLVLYNSLLLTNPFACDSLLLTSGKTTVFASRPNLYRQVSSLFVDGDNFFVFGPLPASSTAQLLLNRKKFDLKVSPEYAHFYDPNTQTFTSKYRGPVKGAIFGFGETALGDYQLADLQVPDTLLSQPQDVRLNYNAAVVQAQKNAKEPEYTQWYNSNGTIQFSIFFKSTVADGIVKALWLINKKNPEQSEFSQISYHTYLYPFSKSGSEGNYDLYFLMNTNKLVVLKDRYFKQGDAFYVNPALLPSVDLNNNTLSEPLKLYNMLTRLPMLPFYFAPEESTETIQENKEPSRKKTYLHGYVTNESLQPLSNVMVLAEVNGKFMYGALTNQMGEYEILGMVPGSYQLKFIHSGYQMKTFKTHFFKAGHSYELSSILKNIQLQRPVLETIEKDFSFMAFNGLARKNFLKLHIYDKETREALSACTLRVYEENNEVVEKTLVGNEDLELAFLPQNKVYRLELTRVGYAPVVFHNLRFCKNSTYVLYLFMISEKNQPWVKKKEYNLQMQYYPADGEIGSSVAVYDANGRGYGISEAPVGSYSSREEYQNLASRDVQVVSKKSRQVPARASEESLDLAANETDALAEIEIAPPQAAAPYASDELIDQVANSSDLNQTRKNFSDVGYWQPNLITDKKGSVSFEVRLPDNITTWKSTVLAVGKYHLHGIDTTETRAYKPLQVSSNLPPFVWVGDKMWANAKFTNLTKDPKTIRTRFEIKGGASTSNTLRLERDYVDSLLIQAEQASPIQCKASLHYEEKYKDEEQRDISVYLPVFRFHQNQSFSMEKDSTYALRFNKGTKGELILNNNLYEKIVEEIKELGQYEYSCVEQLSSQLKALLCKEKINRALERKESVSAQINRIVHQLDNYQNKNGSWGWWKRQPANWRMTIYAVEALGKAHQNGYYNNSYSKGVQALRENFSRFALSDQLYAYSVLLQLGYQDANLKKMISAVKEQDLSASDKLYFYKIKEAHGETIDLNNLYSAYLELNRDLYRPYFTDFFYEPRANLFKAYELFSGSGLAKEWLEVFKSQLSNGNLDKNLNTYSKAAFIEALTASTEHTGNKALTAEVIVNDSLKINSFPYRLPITGSSYRFQHRDAPVFLNTSEENSVADPEAKDSLFKLETYLVQKGQKTKRIQAGLACQLVVDLSSYRSFDYVMIEVPLPSGLRFVNKVQQNGCSIEYFKNKVVIFYERLPMAQHRLTFDMIPVFRGQGIWPAAKCSLMYYPYLYGNNRNEVIEIR